MGNSNQNKCEEKYVHKMMEIMLFSAAHIAIVWYFVIIIIVVVLMYSKFV